MRHLKKFFWLALVAGCTKEGPATLPAPPDIAAPPPGPAEVSRFSAPVDYDFSSLLPLVERIVPRTFGSMDSVKQMGDDSRRHYAWEASRGPFTAFAEGNQMHLRTTLEYSARGFYKPVIGPTIGAGCGKGDARPRLVVELATPLTLTPDWHLVSKTRIALLEPASTAARDHCDVSIFRKDVTPQVVEAARAGLTSQLKSIDRKIGGVDLTDRVTEWWGLLSRPIRLTDGVWLVLSPERLRLGHVTGKSKVLTVPVSLDARPRIITGTAEPQMVLDSLPRLGRDTTGDNTYRVVMDGLVDYGTASRELTEALSEKSFSTSGRSASITKATVIPQPKGRLAVSVIFTGDAKGTLQLIGTPRIDRVRDEIVVPDLDFDLRTSSEILQTFAWLKNDDLRKELRKRARISTSPALATGRKLLAEGLNRKLGDAVTMSGSVDSVAVRGLYVTRDGIVVRAEASGRAGLAVRQR